MKLHEYPYGWLDVLVEAVIRHNLNFSIHDLTCEDELTNALLAKAGSSNLKDHWGDSDDKMVFEPYGDHDAAAKKFAKYLKVKLVTGKPAEWHPKCRRYEFIVREVTPVAASFAELIRCTDWEFKERCKAQDALKRVRTEINSVSAN